jgi:hypothetical protein
MTVGVRTIEVDEKTADLLEARANARGLSVSALLADLFDASDVLPPELATSTIHRSRRSSCFASGTGARRGE